MSVRQKALAFLVRHPCASIAEVRQAVGEHLTYPRVAQVVEQLRREGLITWVCTIERRRYYAPTPAGARLIGADDRRFRRWPSAGTIAERITIMLACLRTGWQLQTAVEMRTHLPSLVGCPHVSDARYAIDFAAPTPVIYYLLPALGTASPRVARKARKQWHERRKFGAFDPYIYNF
jgi:hypothetical protein